MIAEVKFILVRTQRHHQFTMKSAESWKFLAISSSAPMFFLASLIATFSASLSIANTRRSIANISWCLCERGIPPARGGEVAEVVEDMAVSEPGAGSG
jgi:hypothetical protein